MNCENLTNGEILEYIRRADVGEIKLMEVCGTHTMSIAKSGLRAALPENIKLLSGPGCPVCVTPSEVTDEIIKLAGRNNIIIATYGDMLRVPGSRRGESLARAKSLGARVEVIYSPMDAISLARENAGDEVVFLGVGFETTAPGTAAALLAAKDAEISNFSVFSMLKRVEPALRALLSDKDFSVSGFLCPGHVATVIGARGFSFLVEEYAVPCVVGGFEPREILVAVARLVSQLEAKDARLENAYPAAVRDDGNRIAAAMIEKAFVPRFDIWRGLGGIEQSGLGIREELSRFDAEKKFGIIYSEKEVPMSCRCGDIICGRLTPRECPMFGKACTPEDPAGPCMVSSEGACAAAYKYTEV